VRGAVVLNVETSARCQLLLDGVLWGLPALCANGLFSGLGRLTTRLRSHQAKLGAAPPPNPDDGQKIVQRATLLETIQTLQTERQALKTTRRAQIAAATTHEKLDAVLAAD